ncbi:hypothetical protein BLNAU_15121 [Blattamonas nauphoetae]|uniref:Uncharacterized protein n=1 Tax=Blattamonas nauphoetae TaxID=2049346 RepID=A0ABQ9XBV0_9EUKA|nr:hypothetical protein BLNAU_15121 [Blattamonas nauphoetae]
MLSKDASEFEANSRPVTESFNCTALIHQLFPDARFFKSGSVFDFVPNTVSKEFVHLADLEASHSIFGPAHSPTTSFGILNNFMPFIQLVFPVLLLAFSGKPTITLDDSSIKRRSYTKVFSTAIAHTLSNIHVADTASIYVCPHSKQYGLNIHLTPDKFNHTVTAQLQRLCHNFTDSVSVSRCPYAPLLVHVTAQPNETKDGHPTLPEKKGETTPNGANNSIVHFAKSKVLETIEGGRKMIERNTTILTMTDMVLFPPQRLHQRRRPRLPITILL